MRDPGQTSSEDPYPIRGLFDLPRHRRLSCRGVEEVEGSDLALLNLR